MASAELCFMDFPPVAPQLKVQLDRVKARMKAVNINARRLSLRVGMDEGYISQMFHRKVTPASNVMESIAQVLQCDVAYLMGSTDTVRALRGQPIIEIEVTGIADTGAFRRSGGALMTKRSTIEAQASTRYSYAEHFALEVRDNSMNLAEPPLGRGMYALCIDMKTADISVQDNSIYALKRTLDKGRSHETIIRRAHVYNDRIEFAAESSDPGYEKIILSRSVPSTEHEITVIGKVYSAQAFYEE